MALKVRNMIPEDDLRVAQIGHPAPPWLVNYADLMTEMVCFFVILYALSAALNKDMQKASQDIQEMIKEGQMQGQVAMDKEGMRITLEENSQVAFFESGKAELTDQMLAQMDKLAPILRKLSDKFDIVVEGHTDNIPIFTKQFASNWELSTARATNVVKLLLEKDFKPKRMAAVGYGEYHPIVPNDTDMNRKRNRRVVFFIKNNPYPEAARKITVSEGGTGEKPGLIPAAAQAGNAGAQAEAEPGQGTDQPPSTPAGAAAEDGGGNE
jgi:flagellar motor protein MotB